MSDRSRNSKTTQKPRKHAKKTWAPEQGDKQAENSGFKAKKSRNMRPDRSKGMKQQGQMSAPRTNRGPKPPQQGKSGQQGQWIWGLHAAEAALENPKRTLHKIYMSPKCAARMNIDPMQAVRGTKIELVEPSYIDGILGDGAVHQGVAMACAPLPVSHLDEIAKDREGLILVLDQITDPHNVGAMFRLARAFDAKAIIMQDRHAPPLFGATAKVAVGTIESVPCVLVTNIANTLLELQKINWRVTGLAGEADITLQQALTNAEAEVIVMGAEGPGLRKRVRDCCDQLAKIPMPGGAESLNVSTAAAIALYEVVRSAD